jgi:hypothetical protein
MSLPSHELAVVRDVRNRCPRLGHRRSAGQRLSQAPAALVCGGDEHLPSPAGPFVKFFFVNRHPEVTHGYTMSTQ